MVVPLHVRSHFSLGMGTSSVEQICAWAARRSCPAVALTDIENLYGQIRFHHACERAGIRPITGVELRPGFDGRAAIGSRAGRVILLARDRQGYAGLCRIISRRRVRAGSASPAATGEDPLASLDDAAGGLFALTDHVPTLERLLRRGFTAADVRLLLVRPGEGASPEADIVKAAAHYAVRLLADVDAFMVRPDEFELHRLLVALRRGERLSRIDAGGDVDSQRALEALSDGRRLFADVPEAVEETHALAAQCSLDLRQSPRLLPPLRAGHAADADALLERKCRRALAERRERGCCRDPSYGGRLAAELHIIRATGLAAWFLAIAEIVEAAAEREILTSGRGSAAGSLVAWLLRITPVDPVAQGLWFERFLHETRADPPDIDLDVDSRRRDELIDWVQRRFGRERVARVSTMVTWRTRSALRAGLGALGVPPARVARIADGLPAEYDASNASDPDRGVPATLPADLRGAWPLLRQLIGIPRGISVHPGGVVVSPDSIREHVPLQRAPRGVIVTQYDLRSVEHAGLLKIDLLGNHALAEIDETLRRAGESIGVRHMDDIPLDDAPTLATIDRADTIGCFQIETPAVRSVLRRLPVRGIDDVTAALAIVRPGAAAGHAKRAFLRRARGEETVRAPHADVAHGLGRSFGMLLFEEDVLHVLTTMAGISAGEADRFRAAIVSAGDDPERIDELGRRFVQRARDNGRPVTAARAAWRAAARFAAYSFSRAHAASYALLAFRAAYLKTHVPVAFGCALLNHHAGLYPRRTLAADLERHGCRVLPPSVLRSFVTCEVERTAGGSVVRTGLGLVKYLRTSAARTLIAERERRPFADVFDAVERVKLNTMEVRALVLSGAFDALPPLRPDTYPFAHESLLAALAGDLPPEAWRQRVRAPPSAAAPGQLRAYSTLVRIRNELAYLDMHLTDHPMRVLRAEAERVGCVTTAAAAAGGEGRVRIAALIAASRRVRGRGGHVLRFLTIEDETGTLEGVLPPAAHAELEERLTTPGPWLFEGRVRSADGDSRFVVSGLTPFHERPPA